MQIQEANGELFEGIENYVSKMFYEVFNGKQANFYKHLFTNIDYHSMARISPEFQLYKKKTEKFQKERREYEIYDSVDLSKINIGDEKEFKMLMQLLMNIIFTSIADGYRQLECTPKMEIIDIMGAFKVKLNWLKMGLSG